MDHQAVEKEAKKLEQLALNEQTDKMAQELHSLSPADRRAVAKQIEKDAKQDSSGFLPTMEFAASGDLKSVVEVNRVGRDNRREVDHKEYDPATGKLKYFDAKGADNSTAHEEYDSTTGKKKSYDEKNADKSEEHWKYDPVTGNLMTKDLTESNGVKMHFDYDPATGQRLSEDFKDASGNTTYHGEHRYDPTTKKQVSESITNEDGSTKRTEYDAVTGQQKSQEERDKNGNLTYRSDRHYDPNSGNLKSVDIAERQPDGTMKHYQYDPNTGQRKSLD